MPELVQDNAVETALRAIEAAPMLGPDVCNLLRSRIKSLEAQATGLAEELERAERRLAKTQLQDAINFSTLGR